MFELQFETFYMENVILAAIQLHNLMIIQELLHASGTFEALLHVQILKTRLFVFEVETLDIILFIASIEEIIPFENLNQYSNANLNKFQLFFQFYPGSIRATFAK